MYKIFITVVFGITFLFCSTVLAADLTIKWTDESIDEAGFIIDKKDGNDGELSWAELVSLPADTTETVDVCTEGTVCCYRIYSFNAVGKSAFSSNTACGPKPKAPQMLIVQ